MLLDVYMFQTIYLSEKNLPRQDINQVYGWFKCDGSNKF